MSDYKKNRKKKSGLESTSDVLNSLFKNSKLSQQFTRWTVWNNWEKIVGSEISQYSMPVSYYNRTLTLWVEHPAHIQNLQMIQFEIMKKINAFVGRNWVGKLRFDQNRNNKPQTPVDDRFLK